MNVVHLIAPVRFGGGEALLADLLRAGRPGLRESVALVYAAPEFEAALDAAEVAWARLSARSLGDGVPRRVLLFDLWRWPAMLARLARTLSRTKADLVHVHGFPAILLWRLVHALWPVPAIYTHHSHRRPPGGLEARLLGAAYRTCAVRTGVSAVASEAMMAAFPGAGPFVAVHNAVAARFFTAAPDPLVLAARPAGRSVFVQPARFAPGKNQALVVEALGTLDPATRARIAVWFAGEGSERAAVEARAGELGLGQAVRFLGRVPHAAMPGLLAAADFGLFPSELEGFGLGAAECMAAGRPVLALDNALMQEVVGAGGILVARARLAEGLGKMLAAGPGLRARARASAERFRTGRVKDAYCALYARALGRP